jgi:epoxyqueuosine reductase
VTVDALLDCLKAIFKDESLYGFSAIDSSLADQIGCKCALVTLMPYPDLTYMYNPIKFFHMAESLRKEHSKKIAGLKQFLGRNAVRYATPPASPKDDGKHLAEFSYKWAAIHAGLGFIGKNDVFVHEKYAQRVRISCLLIDDEMPVFTGEVYSKCGACDLCVRACPHGLITGQPWHENVQRHELIDYKTCATKSRHDGNGVKYLCARCSLSCTYPECVH